MATGSDSAKAAPIATTAEQEYLESLFWLFEAGFPMTGANLARAMQLSAPTVHEMLRRLERDGYVRRGGGGREIEFTDSGREHAERVVGRHRMIERFLTDVVGVPWDDVHEEAEKLEHAMTPRFEAYVRDAVGDAKTCPHGHPIEVGSRIDGVPLADCQPGVEGQVAANDGEELQIATERGTSVLTFSVAETVSVKADPSPPPRKALPEQLVLGRERYGR